MADEYFSFSFCFLWPKLYGERHPGSEYIIAWNFVTGLAEELEENITVLVGCSDGTFCWESLKIWRLINALQTCGWWLLLHQREQCGGLKLLNGLEDGFGRLCYEAGTKMLM